MLLTLVGDAMRSAPGAGIVFSTAGNMQTLGGNYFNMATATGALTFAPTKAYDACDIAFKPHLQGAPSASSSARALSRIR